VTVDTVAAPLNLAKTCNWPELKKNASVWIMLRHPIRKDLKAKVALGDSFMRLLQKSPSTLVDLCDGEECWYRHLASISTKSVLGFIGCMPDSTKISLTHLWISSLNFGPII
jgi:hypothetical protein